jgi:hypothetical protein
MAAYVSYRATTVGAIKSKAAQTSGGVSCLTLFETKAGEPESPSLFGRRTQEPEGREKLLGKV